MRKGIFIIGLMVLAQTVGAAPKKEEPKKKQGQNREVSFDEILVQGKHHFSDEAVVTVEQDKVLDALLEVRKDFKDRIRKSAKRN